MPNLQRAFKNREVLQALFASKKSQKAAALAKHFDVAEVSIDELQKAALGSNPMDLFNAVKAAATQTVRYSQSTQNAAGIDYVVNFLQALANLSPSMQEEFAKLQASRDADQKFASMQRMLQAVANMQHTDQLYFDLEQALKAAFKDAQQQAQNYSDKLKKAMSASDVARKEYADTAQKVIDSASSNGYFDPLRRIGFLLYAMYDLQYQAPYEEAMHPNANFDPNTQDSRKAYYDLTSKMYGTEGYQPPTPS